MLLCHDVVDEKIIALKLMLQTIRDFGLAIRPCKTFNAYKEISFVGYVVQHGKLMPERSLENKILAIPTPRTKRYVGHY